MSRTLYLEPVGGIAGDMFLAAAIDLGVPVDQLTAALSGLRVPGWTLRPTRAARHAISGTHLDVDTTSEEGHAHRPLAEIRALIDGAATLSPRAKARALAVFQVIGEAEAKIHDVPLDQVHLHEVGAVDSIIDICGAAVALELLGDPEVLCAPPPLGSGFIRAAHGNIPIPAPATLEILRDVPVRFEGVGELTTPTGAGIVKALCKVEAPHAFTVERIGYGVGTKDFKDRPNVLRASIGRRGGAAASATETLFVVEANVDDCSPQLLGALIDAVLARGALDVAVLPATMKKSRPGHLVTVLTAAAQREAVVSTLLEETTTLGVRFHAVERVALERRFEEVATPWGPVKLKLGLRGAEVLNAHPEFEDCRRLAQAHGVPLKQVMAEALAAWHRGRR